MTNHAPFERKKCRIASHTNLYASGIAAVSSIGDIAESPTYWDAKKKSHITANYNFQHYTEKEKEEDYRKF